MKIVGIEGMSPEQVQNEVARGGKFVLYSYCFSIVVMTFRRSTDIYFVRAGENAVVKGLPWTFLSLAVGWWGFPWGLIYTPMALIQNLGGGKNVTPEVLQQFFTELPAAQPPPQVPGSWPPPPNFSSN